MKGTEFRDLTLQQIADKLAQPQPTVILLHVNPDGDTVGSSLALACWLRAMGSPAYCLCAQEIPQRLRFLLGQIVVRQFLKESEINRHFFHRIIPAILFHLIMRRVDGDGFRHCRRISSLIKQKGLSQNE